MPNEINMTCYFKIYGRPTELIEINWTGNEQPRIQGTQKQQEFFFSLFYFIFRLGGLCLSALVSK